MVPPEEGTSAPRISGRASADGTARYAARHSAATEPDFHVPFLLDGLAGESLRISSMGIGTYLGDSTDEDDARYEETIAAALRRGVNLIDTAINYRCQRSERAVGRALQRLIGHGDVRRDEVVVCTKGGYIPLDGEPPPTREAYAAYLRDTYVRTGILQASDVVSDAHALAPRFLADQIGRSRSNLGLETIDVYYLHNPEQQLETQSPEALSTRLRAAFELLEEQCDSGFIASYGCATWNGLRTPPGTKGHLSLAQLLQLAREVGGDGHRFRTVQIPISLALTEAVRQPTQRLRGGRIVTVLEAAAELGVQVIASAVLLQGRLAAGLPDELREALPGNSSDAQRAIAFVRTLPVVSAGLVGMRSVAHLDENMGTRIGS